MLKKIVLAALLVLPGVACLCAAPAEPKIRVVHATDKDEAGLGVYPWSRAVHAEVVEKLGQAGAAWIVLKFVFDAPGQDAAADRKLTAACRKYRNVIVPMSGGMAYPESPANPKWMDRFALKDAGKKTDLVLFKNAAYPYEKLAAALAGSGSNDATPEEDGKIKLMPLVVKVGGRVYPSLGLSVAMLASGLKPGKATVEDNKVRVGKKSLAMDVNGLFSPVFTPPGSLHKIYEYTDILDGRYDKADFKDSIVVLGYAGSRAPVGFPTAASENHNAADIHADIIRHILLELGK